MPLLYVILPILIFVVRSIAVKLINGNPKKSAFRNILVFSGYEIYTSIALKPCDRSALDLLDELKTGITITISSSTIICLSI